MTRFHHAGRPQIDLFMRGDGSGGMTAQPRRNRNHRTSDDHRHGDGAPPVFVKAESPCVLSRPAQKMPNDTSTAPTGSPIRLTPKRIVGRTTLRPGTQASFRTTGGQHCLARKCELGRGGFVAGRDRRCGSGVLLSGKGEAEGAALAGLAFGPEAPAVQLDESA